MRGSVLAAAVVIGLGGLGLASARSRRDASMPAPTTRERAAERLAQNRDCEGCHTDIAQEWRASLHRASYTDPMVQAAITGEDDPSFCRGCHAPEADPRREPDPERAAIGVGCVGCHLIGEDILAAPKPGPVETAPHPVRREAKFAGPEACAGCHEFWFPSAGRGGHELIMQRTVGEHRRSPARDQPCQACHMPPRASEGGKVHRGHGFHVVGEPRMLRAAARITGEREIDEQGRALVRVILAPRAAGHAFPTGDLLRRLLVRVEGSHPCEAERYLARHFALVRSRGGAAIRVEVDDDRVGLTGDPRVVEFALPSACAEQPLRWSVVYQRVLDGPIGDERGAKVWDQLELAHGELGLD
ncbi:MAG: multiheme c-type cytochrome [Enhygromyxa sp.]